MVFSVGDGGIGQPINVLNGEESHGLISINLDVSLELHLHWSVGIRVCLPGDAVTRDDGYIVLVTIIILKLIASKEWMTTVLNCGNFWLCGLKFMHDY